MKKRKKISFRICAAANLRIRLKGVAIFLLAAIPLLIMFFESVLLVSTVNDRNKNEVEKTAVTAAEQYIDMAVESTVSIAKTIYINKRLYDFLDIRYPSHIEYYDAYYNFQESNSIIIAESTVVKDYRIYTANDTILNGGNISTLDDVRDEAWYKAFQEMNKPMLIYCDKTKKTLCFLRRLDYNSLTTGEALLKIDMNAASLQRSFENLDFNGKLFVVSDDVVLFSNLENVTDSEISDIYQYRMHTKNYYTEEILFFACADSRPVMTEVWDNPLNLPAVIVTVVACFCILGILRDLRRRTVAIHDMCRSRKVIDTKNFGRDELGALARNLHDILGERYDLFVEKGLLTNYINEYKQKTYQVELEAFQLDAAVSYLTKYETTDGNPAPTPAALISVSAELANVEDCFRRLDAHGSKQIHLKITRNAVGLDSLYVPPLSILLLAVDIAERALADKQECRLWLTASETAEALSFRLFTPDSTLPAAKRIKLSAIFEPESETAMPDFTTASKYNAYKRIKKHFGSAISLNLPLKDEVDIEFTINKTQPLCNNEKGPGDLNET